MAPIRAGSRAPNHRRTPARVEHSRCLTPDQLRRFYAGDDALFVQIVRELSPRLRRYIESFAANRLEVDELLQDTWAEVFHRRTTFRNAGALERWALKICRTICLSRRRTLAREARLLERLRALVTDDPSSSGASADALTRQGLGDLAVDAVMCLPPQQRLSVIVRILLGIDTAEAAQIMRCAQGTVKATLHQALRNLRRRATDQLGRPHDPSDDRVPPPLRRGIASG